PTMPHLNPMEVYFTCNCGSRLVRILVGFVAKPLRHHGEVNLVLEARVLTADEKLDIVGEGLDQRLDPAALALGEIREHIMFYQIYGALMTDAYPHTLA